MVRNGSVSSLVGTGRRSAARLSNGVEVRGAYGSSEVVRRAEGYGFVTSDEGGDVFLPKGALPAGVTELKGGQKIEFGVVDSRKGAQAMGVKLLEAPPSVAELRRRPAEELHGLIEDMIKVLERRSSPTCAAAGSRTSAARRRSPRWSTRSPASWRSRGKKGPPCGALFSCPRQRAPPE